MSYVTRAGWGARRASHTLARLNPTHVRGIALHWPGDSVRRETRGEVVAALKSWQSLHMDGKGWSDIAYQVAVDQAGNSYSLRGLGYQSAANGNAILNEEYGAALLVLAIGERPSAAMIATTRRIVVQHRRRFQLSSSIVPHSAIRPGGTECPGDQVRRLIDDGAFGRTPAKRAAAK